ncbi:hypothetical protein M3Y98_00943700 [Aphelenchoides besseyi]|nr:hypothetical protein M3Y98_00943700 [Aphelenchoides besseyi]
MSDLSEAAHEIVDDIKRTISEVQTRVSSQQSPAIKSSKKIKSTKSGNYYHSYFQTSHLGITTMSTQIEEIATHFKNHSFARQAQAIDTSNLSSKNKCETFKTNCLDVTFKELPQLGTPDLDGVQHKEHMEEILRLNEALKKDLSGLSFLFCFFV